MLFSSFTNMYTKRRTEHLFEEKLTFAFLSSSVSGAVRFRFFFVLPVDALSLLFLLLIPVSISWLKKGSDKSTSEGISSLSSDSFPVELEAKVIKNHLLDEL